MVMVTFMAKSSDLAKWIALWRRRPEEGVFRRRRLVDAREQGSTGAP
jgi:hypothetical protein